MALIYHSYGTDYFDEIIKYANKIEKFDDELNLKDEEYINFYFNIVKKKEVKNKLLKISLFYSFKIDHEKFIELFFSKVLDLNQNYQIIYDNSYLLDQWPNALSKRVLLYWKKEKI